MSGRFDHDSGSSPLSRPKAQIGVFRHLGSGDYRLLPNVVAEEIRLREGPDPGACLFRYAADGSGSKGYPVRFEDAFPLSATNSNVVRNDDRLLVAAFDPWGGRRWLFDGFAKVPEAELSASHERVSFQAIGVAEREWDTPLGGALMRDADMPKSGDRNRDETGLPARFNPEGAANATDDNADARLDGFKTPVFLDPLVCRSRGIGRRWSLSMAARYILAVGNRGQEYVKLPPWNSVQRLLDDWSPKQGAAFDPSDPDAHEARPIVIRERVVTGLAWPEALHDLLRDHGFGMRFALETGAGDAPVTRLVLWRRDSGDPKRSKELFLQKPGSTLDPSRTNLGAARIMRDGAAVANRVTVETDLSRHEASFVLAPGFAIAGGDVASKVSFRRTSSDYPIHRDKYRTYVLDEAGDGHWDFDTDAWLSGIGTDLKELLGGADRDERLYVKRRRPGRMTLLSRDEAGSPLRAMLSISFDYDGPVPGLWDGTGTWRPIKGEWSLLKDRLGIHLDCLDPNAFDIGGIGTESGRRASRSIRCVEWLAGSPQTKFSLRLTTVVEGDRRGDCTAPRRPSSPTRFTITQAIDAGDRYKIDVVSMWSEFSGKPGGTGAGTGEDIFARNDIEDAIADAQARRASQEVVHLSGTTTIPRLSLSHQVGDRIVAIRGREIDLQTNAGTVDGEAPTYPEVVGITFCLGPRGQSTILRLSDHRADRQL